MTQKVKGWLEDGVTYFMTPKVTMTFVDGFTYFMTQKVHGIIRGHRDLLYDAKDLGDLCSRFDLL